nr:gluconokinase [Hydrococcus rivularis]
MGSANAIEPRICILMGVSGSGKSTVGRLLAQIVGWQFYDGDDFHPLENLAKMSRGIPLSDRDRQPWLLALRDLIDEVRRNKSHAIIACSALKQGYRDLLQGDRQDLLWVYFKGSYEQIWQRIQQRQQHFMKAELLRSQFESLDEPENAIAIDISRTPGDIAMQIAKILNEKKSW